MTLLFSKKPETTYLKKIHNHYKKPFSKPKSNIVTIIYLSPDTNSNFNDGNWYLKLNRWKKKKTDRPTIK